MFSHYFYTGFHGLLLILQGPASVTVWLTRRRAQISLSHARSLMMQEILEPLIESCLSADKTLDTKKYSLGLHVLNRIAFLLTNMGVALGAGSSGEHT